MERPIIFSDISFSVIEIIFSLIFLINLNICWSVRVGLLDIHGSQIPDLFSGFDRMRKYLQL
jgi:hypothetical protein